MLENQIFTSTAYPRNAGEGNGLFFSNTIKCKNLSQYLRRNFVFAAQLLNLTDVEMSVEYIDVMRQSNAAIQLLQSKVKIEDVERLEEDRVTIQLYNDEINTILTRAVEIDDSEINRAVERDLEQLVNARALEEGSSIPSVPESELVGQQETVGEDTNILVPA